MSRLTDVQVDIPGESREGFSYDAVGNRLSQDGIEGESSYNHNNELVTFATTEYEYDANGNATQLLFDNTVMFTYHYNDQDRLMNVEDVNNNTIAEYSYDPFGRRLWKDVSGTRTYFFYADEGLLGEYDSNGAEIRSYRYKPDSTWTVDPLWLKENGEYHYYQTDHLGTPQKLVKQNGAVTWSAGYSAFGQATVEVETVTNNLRFPGQYYNWMRYYASEIGRYLRIDPISPFSSPKKGGDGVRNVKLFNSHSQVIFEKEHFYALILDNMWSFFDIWHWRKSIISMRNYPKTWRETRIVAT